MSLEATITTRLASLEPLSLIIQNDSEAHIGHKGAENGAGHYTVQIVSAQFNDKSPIARHRMVYHLLADLIPEQIHAVCIKAHATEK